MVNFDTVDAPSIDEHAFTVTKEHKSHCPVAARVAKSRAVQQILEEIHCRDVLSFNEYSGDEEWGDSEMEDECFDVESDDSCSDIE